MVGSNLSRGNWFPSCLPEQNFAVWPCHDWLLNKLLQPSIYSPCILNPFDLQVSRWLAAPGTLPDTTQCYHSDTRLQVRKKTSWSPKRKDTTGYSENCNPCNATREILRDWGRRRGQLYKIYYFFLFSRCLEIVWFVDMSGQRFGNCKMLLAKSRAARGAYMKLMWICHQCKTVPIEDYDAI